MLEIASPPINSESQTIYAQINEQTKLTNCEFIEKAQLICSPILLRQCQSFEFLLPVSPSPK